MQKFSELMRGNDLIVAPVALSPIMARLAEEAGFKAVYLSGGSLGWLKCVTEANLTLPELAAVALDMRAVCRLPIVLDAGGDRLGDFFQHQLCRDQVIDADVVLDAAREQLVLELDCGEARRFGEGDGAVHVHRIAPAAARIQDDR